MRWQALFRTLKNLHSIWFFCVCDRDVGASFKPRAFVRIGGGDLAVHASRQSCKSRRDVTCSPNCLASRNTANQSKTVSLSLTGSLVKVFLAASVSNAAITCAPEFVSTGSSFSRRIARSLLLQIYRRNECSLRTVHCDRMTPHQAHSLQPGWPTGRAWVAAIRHCQSRSWLRWPRRSGPAIPDPHKKRKHVATLVHVGKAA